MRISHSNTVCERWTLKKRHFNHFHLVIIHRKKIWVILYLILGQFSLESSKNTNISEICYSHFFIFLYRNFCHNWGSISLTVISIFNPGVDCEWFFIPWFSHNPKENSLTVSNYMISVANWQIFSNVVFRCWLCCGYWRYCWSLDILTEEIVQAGKYCVWETITMERFLAALADNWRELHYKKQLPTIRLYM